jgi:hypothetical protein
LQNKINTKNPERNRRQENLKEILKQKQKLSAAGHQTFHKNKSHPLGEKLKKDFMTHKTIREGDIFLN